MTIVDTSSACVLIACSQEWFEVAIDVRRHQGINLIRRLVEYILPWVEPRRLPRNNYQIPPTSESVCHVVMDGNSQPVGGSQLG